MYICNSINIRGALSVKWVIFKDFDADFESVFKILNVIFELFQKIKNDCFWFYFKR